MKRLIAGAALAAMGLASGLAQAQSYTPPTPLQDFTAETNNNGRLFAGQSTLEPRVMGLRVPNGFRDPASARDDLSRH